MYDIITVGSATVDVFVKTRASSRELLTHSHHRDVCMRLGSKILIDDLTFDTGGGGTNTAVSFARLGFKTGWLGVLGTDRNSRTVLDAVKAEGIDFLGVAKQGSTGYSVILVGLEHDRTILTHKGINDRLADHDVPYSRMKSGWLYCSSMLGESWKTLIKVIRHARKNGTKIAFNPSLYLASQGMAKLAPVIYGLDVLVLNKEEAQALLRLPGGEIPAMLKMLAKRVTLPVITDGNRGAFATDGKTLYSIMPNKVKVVETTGAGDAFASGFVAGRMLDKSVPDCLRLGQAQAEGVLRAIGAKNVLLTRRQAMNEITRRPHTVSARKL